MQHLGTHGHYMSHVTHDACLNVGVETGQGLQSAGHRDHWSGETHDHFMARVMSAMILRISIRGKLFLPVTWQHSPVHKVAKV